MAINRDFASKIATLIGISVGDFSQRLASEIEELSKSVKQNAPVFVVSPQTAAVENLRMRPALKRVMVETIKNIAGPQCQVREEYRLENKHIADIAVLGADGAPKVLIECKTFKTDLDRFYKPAFLAGECWLTKHDDQGQPMTSNIALFHIGLLENSDAVSQPSPAEAKLQASYRQLVGGKLLDGFTLMRVADMPGGETQLYDLPDAPETMGQLLDAVRQASQ